VGTQHKLSDGLVNVSANLGTDRDKATATGYVDVAWTDEQLMAMYRNSWLPKAIINYPAEDSVRKWRAWRAGKAEITRIEAAEKRIGLMRAVKRAMIAARMYGGAAIYINVGTSNPEEPLVPGPGVKIKSLVVMSRRTLRAGDIVRDIDSTYLGQPEFYELTSTATGNQTRIHASRLVTFTGAPLPADSDTMVGDVARGWGDSVLQSTIDAIRANDGTIANIASLVFEAKVDVFKFAGFADMLADGHDDAVIKRLRSQATIKGINGAVVLDGEDDYQQKLASFAGIPDVMDRFMLNVSGAAGIPVTRLFGRSAAGLSGSGDGDERTYFDRVNHEQSIELGPSLAVLDECLLFDALGSRNPEIFYEWNPLRQMTETERAKIFIDTANAARAIAGPNSGALVPLDALSESLVNELTEQGVLPGLGDAVAEVGTLSEQYGFVEPVASAQPVGDMAPRPLYVQRKVINFAEIRRHYAAQGVTVADDMHVTVTYSRTPVDWLAMGESYARTVLVAEGGPRVHELFGPDGDTLVLSFASDDLRWRHESMIERGASWDWADYQPHITLAVEWSGDVGTIEPWRGEIQLSPEIFEDLQP